MLHFFLKNKPTPGKNPDMGKAVFPTPQTLTINTWGRLAASLKKTQGNFSCYTSVENLLL